MDHICKRLFDSREQNWSRTRGQRHERDEQGHGARPCVVDSFFFLVASLLRLCFFVVSLTSQSNSVAGGDEEGMKAGAAGFSELMLGRRCFGRRGKVDGGFLLRGTVSEVSFSLFFSSSDLLFFLLRARFSSFAQLRFLLCFFRAILPLPLSSCTFLNRGEGG